MTPAVLTRPEPAPTPAERSAPCCPACGYGSAEAHGPAPFPVLTRRVKRRQKLYRIGDPLHALYVVRSGTFKSTMATADGGEQVTGFQMTGEVLGLDAVAEGVHATNAIALEDSELLVLPYAEVRQLAVGSDVGTAISRLMSREIVHDYQLMMLRANAKAAERVAAFLLQLSGQMKARGYAAGEFHLRMSRGDIASYLGMTLETVSRTLSDLHRKGVLRIDQRHVRIEDLPRLNQLMETGAA